MTTITREWLIHQISSIEAVGITDSNTLEAFKLALASLEAEAVAIVEPSDYVTAAQLVGEEPRSKAVRLLFEGALSIGQKLYAAPPVVPDELSDGSIFNDSYIDGWNACRAAMLQDSQPVSNRDELPLDYLQGHKDGLEWAAQLAEANHPQTGDWLYDDQTELAKAIRKGPDMPPVESGNSPVIPDEVLSAIRKVARIRTDLDDFDGDRRGIADCLDEAEQELIVTINEHAAMLQTGNDSTTGKPLTITLPDITSKAFWSGTGKSETFHPETYKRWVKEAIERACVITGIRVVVK